MASVAKKNFKNESEKKERTKKNDDTHKIQISKVNEIIDDCKGDWETARLKKCEKTVRDEAINKIYSRIQGNITHVLRKRTGSKILQTIYKFGCLEVKDKIFEEIKDDIPSLSNCSFSIFFLQKLLSTKYFHTIIEILGDKHKRIITDRVGAFFLDEAYQKLKKGPQKDFLKKLLGNKARVFYANKKIMDIPEKELDFGDLTRKMLDKGLTNLTIAHDLLSLHMNHFEDLEERKVFLRGLVEFFIDFVHTINGRKLAYSMLEDEKNTHKIIKQIGDHLIDLMKSEESREILIYIISNYEEKEVQKYIFKEIKTNLQTFLNTVYFDEFLTRLIEIEKFDYLKEKFLEEVSKKDAEYNKIFLQIASNYQTE